MDNKKLSRIADFAFGVPLVLVGGFAIFLDIFTLILTSATGERSLWVVPLGTILGIGPFLFGGYLVFRSRKPVDPPDA